MAVWQYQLNIIPKKAILEKYGVIPNELFINKEGWKKYWENVNYDNGFPEPDFEDARTIKWWKNIDLNIQETADQIDSLVTRGNWSNDKDFIGWKGDTENEEDNDCHIAFDEKTKEISEFQFRTDLRNLKNVTKFMNGMLKICSNNNLLVLNTEGLLLEPKRELVFENIKKSNAVKFLTDPIKFIEEIADNEENRVQVQRRKQSIWDRIKKIVKTRPNDGHK